MLNGWFTIAAQAVNFLILVGLLKHFLYKPILQAIDAREQGIAAQLASAAAKEATAKGEGDDFRHKNEVFDGERAALLAKATDDAKVEGARLLDVAKKEADALRAKRLDAMQVERKDLERQIRLRTQNQVFAIARKTLADLASPCLEARMSEVFIARLKGLEEPAKSQLATALEKSTSQAIIRTAMDIPPAQRAEIDKAVAETFDAKKPVHLQFQIVPELISGIELSANGQKVAWSIAEYLSILEESSGGQAAAEDKPEPAPDAKPKPPAPTSVRAKPDGKPSHLPASATAKGHR